MGPVVQVVAPDAPDVMVVVACVLAACAATVAVVLLTRSWRRRRAALDAALLRSREEVESLSRKVEELTQEVVRARRTAERDREYVITSLTEEEPRRLDPRAVHSSELVPATERPAVGRLLEDQLVLALARQPDSAVRRRWTDLAVTAVALGHGVRRAMSADVLDRAAAEAHVARRRSRRERRRQVRRRAASREVA